MEENQTFERNRIGCPIHKRQEKILRVEIGKEVRGYRLIQNHKRRRSEIIEESEPIRLFFFSLDGELDLNPITKPMRIAKYRLCEWTHPIQKVDSSGQKSGDLTTGRGCILIVDDIENVPIYNECSECHGYTSHDEDRYAKELNFMCIGCFCEQTNQNDLYIWS
jgi:hypothetical protein